MNNLYKNIIMKTFQNLAVSLDKEIQKATLLLRKLLIHMIKSNLQLTKVLHLPKLNRERNLTKIKTIINKLKN